MVEGKNLDAEQNIDEEVITRVPAKWFSAQLDKCGGGVELYGAKRWARCRSKPYLEVANWQKNLLNGEQVCHCGRCDTAAFLPAAPGRPERASPRTQVLKYCPGNMSRDYVSWLKSLGKEMRSLSKEQYNDIRNDVLVESFQKTLPTTELIRMAQLNELYDAFWILALDIWVTRCDMLVSSHCGGVCSFDEHRGCQNEGVCW